MQRFHLTLLLASAASVGALVAPTLQAAPSPVPSVVPQPAVAEGGELSLRAGLDRPVLRQSDERYIVVELSGQAPLVEAAPVDLAVVLDVSGSMSGSRIRDARDAVEALTWQLEPTDRVSLVAFSDQAYELVHLGTPAQVREVVRDLRVAGGTNVEDALRVAGESLSDSGNPLQRAFLLSDGEATVGHTLAHQLVADATRLSEGGVQVSAMALGTGVDQSALMGIADATGGDYLYLSSPSEVAGSFSIELDRLRRQAARDARVELILAEGVQVLDVYGYEDIDGRATSRGWIADVGGVVAGETRKVVARVHVPVEVAATGEIGQVEVRWTGRREERAWLPLEAAVGDGTDQVEAWASSHVLDARTGRALGSGVEARGSQGLEAGQRALRKELLALEELATTYQQPVVARREAVLDLENTWRVAAPGEELIDLEAQETLRALGYVE